MSYCSQWTNSIVCREGDATRPCTWVSQGGGRGYCREPLPTDKDNRANEDPQAKCSDETTKWDCMDALSTVTGERCVWFRNSCVDRRSTAIEDAIREFGMEQGGERVLSDTTLKYYFTAPNTEAVIIAVTNQNLGDASATRERLEAVQQLALFLGTLESLSSADRAHVRRVAVAATDRIATLPPPVIDIDDDLGDGGAGNGNGSGNDAPEDPEESTQQLVIAGVVLGVVLLLVVAAVFIRGRRNRRQAVEYPQY